MRKTVEQVETQKVETIAALNQFKKGDRVFDKLTKKHGVFHSPNFGNSMPSCWVRFDDLYGDEWFIPPEKDPGSADPLDLKLCQCNKPIPPIFNPLPSSVCSQEWAASANLELLKPDLQTNSKSRDLSNPTPTDNKSSPDITLIHQSTQTLEITPQILSPTYLSADFLAEVLVPLEQEKDCLIPTPIFGLKCCGLLRNPSQLLWLLKTWQVLLIEGFEQCLGDSEWLATSGKIRSSYQQRNSARPTSENECLLLPTPVAYSRASKEYRPPGGDKLETALKLLPTPTAWGANGRARTGAKQGRNLETELRLLPTPTATDVKGKRHSKLRQGGMDLETALEPLIPPNHVSHPAIREYMMGVKTDYTDTIETDGEQLILPPEKLAQPQELASTDAQESPPLEILALHNRQRSHGEGSVILQELSIDEERLRQHLERKVEKAFIKAESVFREAVFALKEIRDRKLYKSTYETFEEYCKERFNFKRARPYQLISAAVVLENLQNLDLQMCTKTEIGTHLLPTNERQIRDLVDLEPEEQVTVWGRSVRNGKIPSGEKIKDILNERIRERLGQPPIPTYIEGDVVEISSGGSSTLREHDGMWGIVTEVLSSRYKVYISLRNTEVRCKGNELERVDEQHTLEIRQVSDRIKRLSKRDDLDSSIWWILEGLARQTCFTKTQMDLLEWAEKRYEAK